MKNLTNEKILSHDEVKKLSDEEAKDYWSQLNDWGMINCEKIYKPYTFENFKEVMEFVNKVADLAEREGHHPEMQITYRRATVFLKTNFVKGLSINDFIVAAKIDQIS